MRGEELRDGAGAALFVGLDALEEGDVGVGIVAGLVHVLDAEEVGFAFSVAREFQKGERNGEVHALVDAVAGPAVGHERS